MGRREEGRAEREREREVYWILGGVQTAHLFGSTGAKPVSQHGLQILPQETMKQFNSIAIKQKKPCLINLTDNNGFR